jgi:RNA polymerase sigma factor (sigma-70 family)
LANYERENINEFFILRTKNESLESKVELLEAIEEKQDKSIEFWKNKYYELVERLKKDIKPQIAVFPDGLNKHVEGNALCMFEEYDNEKDNAFTLETIISDTKEDKLLDLLTLNDAINSLNEKEKILINLRFYKEFSQKEVANKFNVSQVQISRLEKQILEKLKKYF